MIKAKIIDATGSKRGAKVTRTNALKVSLAKPDAQELTQAELTREKHFKAYLSTVSGGTEMNVDGSTTPVVFSIRAQKDRVLYLTTMRLVIFDNYWGFGTASNFRRFGTPAGAGGLTNGLLCYVEQGNLQLPIFVEVVKTEGDFLDYADTSNSVANAYASNVDWAGFDFDFQTPVVIAPNSQDTLTIVVRDNLTSMVKFRAIARGWQEIF